MSKALWSPMDEAFKLSEKRTGGVSAVKAHILGNKI